MLQTIEALVDENGGVRLLESVTLPSARRALVTILDQSAPGVVEAAFIPPSDAGEAAEIEAIRAKLQMPLAPAEIRERQDARERLEILVEQLNAEAHAGETPYHTLESLTQTVAATYEEREREQF